MEYVDPKKGLGALFFLVFLVFRLPPPLGLFIYFFESRSAAE